MIQKKKDQQKRYFFLFALFFLLIKLFLMKDVTIYAITTAFADDQLMVHIAEKLLRLNWLGGYNHYTLAKGFFFPFFLAVGKALHIDYISWVQIFYAIACYLFVKAISPVIRFRWMLYVFYLLLLFHPIMASSEVIQRVYRNSITPAQVFLLKQSFFYLIESQLMIKAMELHVLNGLLGEMPFDQALVLIFPINFLMHCQNFSESLL